MLPLSATSLNVSPELLSRSGLGLPAAAWSLASSDRSPDLLWPAAADASAARSLPLSGVWKYASPRNEIRCEQWRLGGYAIPDSFRRDLRGRLKDIDRTIFRPWRSGDIPCEAFLPPYNDAANKFYELKDRLNFYPDWADIVGPSDTSVSSEIAFLELECLDFLADRLDRKVEAARSGLRTLTERTLNPDLIARWNEIESAKIASRRKIDLQSTLRRQDLFLILVSDTLTDLAAQAAGKTGGPWLEQDLRPVFFEMATHLFRLDLFEEGFDAETTHAFTREVGIFYASSLKDSYAAFGRILYSHMNRHLLLGKHPTADGLLKSVTENLKAYRRLFKAFAGKFWLRRSRFVQELTRRDGSSTGFFLSLERGIIEFESGLGVYLYEDDPAGRGPYGAVARLGLFFGGDDSVRIVNFQTAAVSEVNSASHLADQRERFKAALGGLGALDALVASAIYLAVGMGARRMEGISDEAQQAFTDEIAQGKRHPFYDPTFARFGFAPPAEGRDVWSLDLKSFSLFDPEVPSKPNHMLEYFWKVLSRRNPGNRIKYADWRKQKPNPSSPKYMAFLISIAGAIDQFRLKKIPPEERGEPPT
ncbi:MAG TPA: hypothetical protein VFX30_13030 [bacterium]|nr:hypothetical protein [bacterium]